MALLTPTVLDSDGATVTLAAATAGAGDTFANEGGGVVFVVNNGGGSPITVTFDSQAAVTAGEAQQDRVVAVANGARVEFSKIEKAFEDANGIVHVTYSAVTSVTVGVVDPT